MQLSTLFPSPAHLDCSERDWSALPAWFGAECVVNFVAGSESQQNTLPHEALPETAGLLFGGSLSRRIIGIDGDVFGGQVRGEEIERDPTVAQANHNLALGLG